MNRILKPIYALTFCLSIIPFLLANGQERLLLGSEQQDLAHSLKMYQGKYYIVGTTRPTAHSTNDYYLIELRPNGTVERKIVYGFPKRDIASQVVVDEEGIFICGSVHDNGYPNVDMHLVKINQNGNTEWEKYYGTEFQDQGFNLIRTSDGGFAMIGFSNSLEDFGDMYVVKTDKDGEVQWENFFGPRYVDYGFSLIENPSGEFVFVGTQNGFYNPTQTDFQTHDADILIVKTNKDGEEIWHKTYGGTSHDWAKDIILAPGGGYFVSGSTQSEGAGSFDVFLIKIDEDGNELWKKTFGGTEFEYGEKLVLGADGNIYISATSASFSENGKPDNYILKTDTTGELIWSKVLGDDGSEYSSGVVATPDSGIVFTGWTNKGKLGKYDILFYKLSKNGEVQIISNLTPFDSVRTVVIYPNPARRKFTVDFIASDNDSVTFYLYDLNGEKIDEKILEANSKTEFIPNSGSGTYIYRVEKAGEVFQSGKLILTD